MTMQFYLINEDFQHDPSFLLWRASNTGMEQTPCKLLTAIEAALCHKCLYISTQYDVDWSFTNKVQCVYMLAVQNMHKCKT